MARFRPYLRGRRERSSEGRPTISAAATGCRLGELLALQDADVHDSASRLLDSVDALL